MLAQLVDRERLAEDETLKLVGSEPHQLVADVLGLDLLGDHAEPQFVSEDDQRRDHAAHLSGSLVAQVAIELQRVDRQLAELREGGKAGPEVVERDCCPLPADRAGPDAPCRFPCRPSANDLEPRRRRGNAMTDRRDIRA
jgi:hypothetical protein